MKLTALETKYLLYDLFGKRIPQFSNVEHCFFPNDSDFIKLFKGLVATDFGLIGVPPYYSLNDDEYIDNILNDEIQADEFYYLWNTQLNQHEIMDSYLTNGNGDIALTSINIERSHLKKIYQLCGTDEEYFKRIIFYDNMLLLSEIADWIILPVGSDDRLLLLVVSEKERNLVNDYAKLLLKKRNMEVGKIIQDQNGSLVWFGEYWTDIKSCIP